MPANPDNTLLLSVVTPQGIVLSEPASSVAFWTSLGEIEVLPGHAPTVVLVEPGEMRIRNAAGSERAFATGEGFARIDIREVTFFSDMAEDAAEIVLDQVQEAKSRAEQAVAAAANLSGDERLAADLALRESLVKIQILMRRKHGSQPRGPVPTE